MKLVSCEKSKAEVYKLRFDNSAFASITLEEISERAGRISISCDWGNWSYFWGSMGMPLKEFISDLDKGYLAGKFGVPFVMDEEATKAGIYDLIKELRKGKDLTADEAKDICFDIKRNIDFDNANSVASFNCDSYKILNKKASYFVPHEYIQQKLDPSFGVFYDNVWKEFVEILKNEKDSVVLDENTPVSMLEYDAAVSSLSETIEDLRKHIAMLQKENTRLVQIRR